MRRIIEILQIFQSNLEFVSLPYLVEKFALTVRTLQNDISRINRLLANISDCKIIKKKDQLIIVGNNPKLAVDNLLKKLLTVAKYNNNVKQYQLIFYHTLENQPLTNAKLLSFTNSMLYDLKKQISLVNNCFNYYDLKLKLKFKVKQGWFLQGSEVDLRLFVTRILITQKNSSLSNNYLDTSLVYLQNKLATILLNNHFYDYFSKEIIWFLVIVIKRIKLNKRLERYYHPLLSKILFNNQIILSNFIKLSNILEKEFSLKFDYYEAMYFKSLMLLNQKKFDNNIVSKLILSLNAHINYLIFKEYQLEFIIEKFNTILNEFLNENFLKLLFSFYQEFNCDFVKNNTLWNSSYWFGWEIVNIIVFALRKFNINIKFRLFVSDYLLMTFSNFYVGDKEKSWKVPLYYQVNNSFSYQDQKIVLFIKNNYKNIILKSLNINNSHYKRNFLNKDYAILIDHEFDNNLLPNKRVFLINKDRFLSNQHLKQNFDFAVSKMLIDKICNSILVFNFFFKQKFSTIKSLLTYLQEALVRKFKLKSHNFHLEDSFINSNYLLNKILIVHKLVTKNNVNLPIILIYLKNPLVFHKKFSIHFIFILLNNSDTLYQYQGLLSYIDVIKNNFNVQINSVMNLYQIINNFNS